MAGEQNVAFAFFSKLSAGREPSGEANVITTHAAWIFLAGERVYKLKRAVDLGFLNFTSLDARKRACQREITLNQQFAPRLYRGLMALVETGDGELELRSADDADAMHVVEWAVELNRFDNDSLLSHLMGRNAVPEPMLQDLANTVQRMQTDASRAFDPAEVQRLSGVIGDVADALTGAPLVPNSLAEQFRSHAETQFKALSGKMTDRLQRGFVRRCHGDLHCENIVVINGVPTPFDALEFDERLGTVDVLYDLGFLLMDLTVRGGTRPANIVMNTYLDAAREVVHLRDLDCLRFFMALRAGIRAMVIVFKLRNETGKSCSAGHDAVVDYLNLALELLEPMPPRLFAIAGGSGTGKSTVSRELAPRVGPQPGAVHLRSDAIRKELAGVSLTTRLPSSAYTQEASNQVYRAMLARAELALAAGQSVIVDAVFGKRAERASAAELAKRRGVVFSPAWLILDAQTQHARVTARIGDVSDATPNILSAQRATLEIPADWPHLDASADAATLARSIAPITSAT